MGLSREQWDALSPQKQAEYQARQHALDAEAHRQEMAYRMERKRAEEAQLRAEQGRVRRVYASAKYGDIIRVTVQGGALQIYGKQYPYYPVSFELARGEARRVRFTQAGRISRTVDFEVRLSEDGNTLYFDDSNYGGVVLVNRDWERGQEYHPAGNRANKGGIVLTGAAFFVKYKELPGAPRRIIIENR